MHGALSGMGRCGEGRNLIGRVQAALFRQVGQAQRRRLGLVYPPRAAFGNRLDQRIGVDLRVFAGQVAQRQPPAVEFRRTAFILGNMRLAMTENRAPGRRNTGQREGIGGGAGGDEKHAQIRLENRAQALLDPQGQRIDTVGTKRPTIGASHRLDDLRCRTIAVIAGEIHQCPPSIT